MKRRAVIFIINIFLSSVLALEQLPDPVLLPRDVFVGDTAELVFFQEFPVPDKVREDGLTIPGSHFEGHPDYRIELVSLSWQGSVAEIHVRFVSWKTGVIELPPLTTDYGTLTVPPVTIASVVDRDGITVPSPARSPLLIPGTTWVLYGTLLGILFVTGLVWFLVVKVRIWLVTGPGKRLAARRYRYFLREIRLLSRRNHKSGDSWWYGRLSRALKSYLGLYFYSDVSTCLSQTGTELVLSIQSVDKREDSDGSPGRAAETLESLFAVIDRVRFGGSESGVMRSGLLESAVSFVKEMEELADHGIS